MRIRGRWLGSSAALAAYAVTASLLYQAALRDWQHREIGLGGDPVQATWYLSWAAHALTHGLNPLLTTAMNAPAGLNLMWNTPVILGGLVLAPVTLVAGPVAAYNVLVAGSVALSAWAGFLLVRRHVRRTSIAWIGGLVYGFSPYFAAQALGHADLVVMISPPLLVILLEELAVGRRYRAVTLGAIGGAIAVAQLLVFEEVLASEAIMLAILGLVLLVQRPSLPRDWLGRVAAGFAMALATFVALGSYPLLVQFTGPQALSGPAIRPDSVSSDLEGFVLPSARALLLAPAQLASRAGNLRPGFIEHGEYLGAPLIVLLLILAWRWRHDLVGRTAIAVTAVVFVLSLGPRLWIGGHETSIPLPGRLLTVVPFLGQALPARFAAYAWLAVGVVVARLGEELLARRGDRRTWPLGALAIASLAAIVPVLPYPSSAALIPAYFAAGAPDVPENGIALIAPFPSPYDVDGLLWHAATGTRFGIVGGYAYAPAPHGHVNSPESGSATGSALIAVLSAEAPPAASVARVRADLRRWRVDTVIAGPMPHRDAAITLLTRVLGRPPAARGRDVAVWTDVPSALERVGA